MPAALIRSATNGDVHAIKRIAVDAEMFSLAEDDGVVVAAANFAPEPFADRMWNLYFVAVTPSHQGQRLGQALIAHIEAELAGRGSEVARVLVIETSSTDQYTRTREFYRGLGYDAEARIRQFYGPDDDKIVFWKSLLT